MSGERVTRRTALLWPGYDPRLTRSFTAGNDSPPTAIAAGALTLKHDAPVLIEHEGNRPVGRVRELFRMPWPDAVWHAAIVELDEDWPGSRGVSVGIVPLAETALLDGHRIIERGVVDEISITSRPAVPGARLLPASETRAAETRAAPVAQPLVLRRPFGTVLRIR